MDRAEFDRFVDGLASPMQVVTTATDGERAELTVRDNGPGLPEAVGDQIFARFVRSGGPADLVAYSGTGLGLAIVKAVAESHRGRVVAGDAPSGGAEFVVTLPLGEPAAEPAAAL